MAVQAQQGRGAMDEALDRAAEIMAQLADGREPAVDPVLVARRDGLAAALAAGTRAGEAVAELRTLVPGALEPQELERRTKAALRRRDEAAELVALYTDQLAAAEPPIAEARATRGRALAAELPAAREPGPRASDGQRQLWPLAFRILSPERPVGYRPLPPTRTQIIGSPNETGLDPQGHRCSRASS